MKISTILLAVVGVMGIPLWSGGLTQESYPTGIYFYGGAMILLLIIALGLWSTGDRAEV